MKTFQSKYCESMILASHDKIEFVQRIFWNETFAVENYDVGMVTVQRYQTLVNIKPPIL